MSGYHKAELNLNFFIRLNFKQKELIQPENGEKD